MPLDRTGVPQRASQPDNQPASCNSLLPLSLLVLLLIGVTTSAWATEPAVSVELNKLESNREACRAYLVVENGAGAAFETLKLDLVLFDTDGVVAKRLATTLLVLALVPVLPHFPGCCIDHRQYIGVCAIHNPSTASISSLNSAECDQNVTECSSYGSTSVTSSHFCAGPVHVTS